MCFIRGCMFKGATGQKYNDSEKEILKHASITNVDYKEVLAKKYHDDKKAFLFVDPPYLLSNNKTYTTKCRIRYDTSNC
ncbi:MAG: hypothetical protein ACKPKO_08530 [Candidatus Fonsibacter sp.]